MKKILKTPPADYQRTNEVAFIFDPESTYASPYVLCQKWKSGPAWEWVQVPVVSLSDEEDEQQVPPHYLRHHRPGDDLPHHLQT